MADGVIAAGDCLHASGTASDAAVEEVRCSSSEAQYKVVQKVSGTRDDSKCDAVTEATTTYVQYGGGFDAVLCLKEVK